MSQIDEMKDIDMHTEQLLDFSLYKQTQINQVHKITNVKDLNVIWKNITGKEAGHNAEITRTLNMEKVIAKNMLRQMLAEPSH